MSPKKCIKFGQSALTKKTIKNEPEGFFQFCFQIWEGRRQLFNPIIPGLLKARWTWGGGGRNPPPPNSLVFNRGSIKFGM